jgi:hypothetical protein
MIKDRFVEDAYPARKPGELALRISPRLSRGSASIIILLISLGLWWVIWIAVSSLVFS